MTPAEFRAQSSREYVAGLRDPQRPWRNRVALLREQNHPESTAAADRLEAALDHINAAWAEPLAEVVRDVCPQTGNERAAA